MTALRLDHLLTGRVAPLGERGAPSAIAKQAVAGPLHLGPLGLETDEQGDLKVHGGADKAIHHYPFDHYAAWRETCGDLPLLDAPGAFGENLSTTGLTEDMVAVGDIFRLGGALIEVSQGRQPCWKLNVRFDVPAMSRLVQDSGRTGWYYRVLEPGMVQAGDSLALVDRRSPAWSIRRLWHTLYVDTMNIEALTAMAALAHLPDGWRKYAARRLASRQVEDWGKRLTGD